MPGPIPNRSGDLSRTRNANRANRPPLVKGESLPAEPYEADPDWHPIALQLWEAMKVSGQSAFYEQSDWAYAYSLCEDLSDYKQQTRRSGQMAQTIYSNMSNLMLTEGDRRRLRVELDDPAEETEDASVTAITAMQAVLGVAQ